MKFRKIKTGENVLDYILELVDHVNGLLGQLQGGRGITVHHSQANTVIENTATPVSDNRLSVREITICVRNEDGTLTERNMLVYGSAPY